MELEFETVKRDKLEFVLEDGVRVLPYIGAFRRLAPRNDALTEAVVVHERTIWYSWVVSCDANMCPEDFKKRLWCQSRHVIIEVPSEGIPTCRSKGPNDELIECEHYTHLARFTRGTRVPLFGRFTEQYPLAGYEPNTPIEVSSEATCVTFKKKSTICLC